MMHNIGLNRLIIQTYIGESRLMVYDLPKREKFIDFIDYNTYNDFGFKTDGLRIEASSCIPFITIDSHKERILLNVMMVDAYYDDP